MIGLYVYTAMAAFVLSCVVVAGLRRWAGRRLLDIPNERSSHVRPVPRGGGLAIVVVVLAGSLLVLPFSGAKATALQWLMYFSGALLIAAVSWLDDLYSVPPPVRFAVHLVAALLACLAVGAFKQITLPVIGSFSLGIWGWPLALVWIVGLTNAYNFMDGIDGIAGGQAVVAGLGWAIIGWLGGQPMVGSLGLLIAGASAGFLVHNWPPARIFMGDVGSAFIGYMLAVLTLMASQANPVFVLAGIGLVWPFVFDAALTFFMRLCRGEKVWEAHRSHLYQRLVISGLSHGRVAMFYTGLAALGAVWAIALVQGWRAMAVGVLVLMAAAAVSLACWTHRRERH